MECLMQSVVQGNTAKSPEYNISISRNNKYLWSQHIWAKTDRCYSNTAKARFLKAVFYTKLLFFSNLTQVIQLPSSQQTEQKRK